jgi:hypothetical protein
MCANPVTPSGGPKDTEPPVITKSEPPLNTVNFNAKKIRIAFNEFIQLKDINSQAIISPPMNKMPSFKLRGKSLIIEFQEPLKENSTYNVFLGNSIVDLTESNPFDNFQYVFSTSNVIDSMSFQGTVINSFDLTPAKGVNVMLYLDNNDTIPFDSLPYFVKPYYLTRTDASGKFSLNNLMQKSFKIFALNDQNGNFIYDQPGEFIAFSDSMVNPIFAKVAAPDSIVPDSMLIENFETLMAGSSQMQLYLFQEADSKQRLVRASLIKKGLVSFIFKKPVSDLSVRPLNISNSDSWGIQEDNSTKDTINFWLKNIEPDSVRFEISDAGIILDTVDLAVKKKEREKKRSNTGNDTTYLSVKTELKTNHAELYLPFILYFEYPVVSYQNDKINLFEDDSIPLNADYHFTDHTQRKFAIDHEWKSATSYKLSIIDSAFFDLQGKTNDTLTYSFISKSTEDYGNFLINIKLKLPGTNTIFQLLSGDKIIEEIQIKESQRLSFKHLAPGDYKLKAIFDRNSNGKWDTGDYIHKIQPEKIMFFSQGVTVRANWDVEEDWEL